MIGVVGALVALAVLAALVLVLAVRPAVRRLDRAAAGLRSDLSARLAALDALRPSGRHGRSPSPAVPAPSTIGGGGRHRRVEPAP